MIPSPAIPHGERTPFRVAARAARLAPRFRRWRATPIASDFASEATVTLQLERPLGPAEAARVARVAGARLGVDATKLERLLLRRGTRDLTRPIPAPLARRVAAAFEGGGARLVLAPGAPRAFSEGWGRGMPSLPVLTVAIWAGISGVVALGYLLLAAPWSFALFG